MIYTEDNARTIAKIWRVDKGTLTRWKRLNTIPDHKAFYQPLSKKDLELENKIIRLVESGWLKARPLSKLIGRGDRINALLTARRYPDDPRFHIRHLNSSEIKNLKPLLNNLQRSLGALLYLASLTPDDKNYGEVIQTDLRGLLGLKYLNGVNVRTGMDNHQQGRFWAFMRGGNAKREDIDIMLERLKLPLDLLLNQ